MRKTGNAFEKARLRRDWTWWRAAQVAGVSEQSLKNLEWGDTDPAEVKVKTAVAIIEAYWPDVQLSEFCPGTKLKVVPKDRLSVATRKYIGSSL